MKLTFFNSSLIFGIGMIVVLVGAFMKVQEMEYHNSVLFAGLALEFIGTVWFVLSLYRRRKTDRD